MKRLLLLFTLLSICSFAQDKLDKSKKELTSESKNKTETRSSQSKNADIDPDNPVWQIVGYVFFGAFKYGFIGDYKNEEHLYNNLTPHPFYNQSSGNFESDTVTVSKKRFRLDVENSFIYSSNDLLGNHLKVKIRPFQFFYLQTDFHQLYEINRMDGTNFNLSLFHFNLGYDRIRLEKFNLGWTLGASYVGNEVGKAGLTYGINAEYFMGNHISFMGSAKWSRINSQPVNALELQGKFHRKKYFFALGFEHLKMATPTYNFIALGGGIYF